jgi:hypothetical protein
MWIIILSLIIVLSWLLMAAMYLNEQKLRARIQLLEGQELLLRRLIRDVRICAVTLNTELSLIGTAIKALEKGGLSKAYLVGLNRARQSMSYTVETLTQKLR